MGSSGGDAGGAGDAQERKPRRGRPARLLCRGPHCAARVTILKAFPDHGSEPDSTQGPMAAWRRRRPIFAPRTVGGSRLTKMSQSQGKA